MDPFCWGDRSPDGGSPSWSRPHDSWHLQSLHAFVREATQAVYEMCRPPSRAELTTDAADELDRAWEAFAAMPPRVHAAPPAETAAAGAKDSPRRRREGSAPHAPRTPRPQSARPPPRPLTLMHSFDRHAHLSFGAAGGAAATPPPPRPAHARPQLAREALLARAVQASRRPGCLPSRQRAIQRERQADAGAAAAAARVAADAVAMRISSYSHASAPKAQPPRQVSLLGPHLDFLSRNEASASSCGRSSSSVEARNASTMQWTRSGEGEDSTVNKEALDALLSAHAGECIRKPRTRARPPSAAERAWKGSSTFSMPDATSVRLTGFVRPSSAQVPPSTARLLQALISAEPNMPRPVVGCSTTQKSLLPAPPRDPPPIRHRLAL
ncbi:hypothetical protein AB1Y20_007373 [Prymnesium parvum]|uniref:Uncharacterized protein n=1 Tax=Prymnesium parvum TaxID=97485 RepID=A0AB34IWY2_PRYPA